jgi:hypothetical protein
MGVPGLLRLAALTMMAIATLLSGCAGKNPRVVDETKLEEWGRCDRSRPPGANLLCLQLRQPM